MPKRILAVTLSLLFLSPGVVPSPSLTEAQAAKVRPEEEEDTLKADSVVAPHLLRLLDERKFQTKITARDRDTTVYSHFRQFTTPDAFRVNLRVQEIGVPVAQALTLARHEQLRGRLLEAARWMNRPYSRAEALLGLASTKNPDHLKFFREALLDFKKDIQFAGLEALKIWGGKEGAPLAMKMTESRWSKVIQVYAAKVAYEMGERRAMSKLKQYLRDRDWIARAMAARYLGELGRPSDEQLLLSRIGPERDNNFVLAEVCIAAMNLAARRKPVKRQPPPPIRKRRVQRSRDIFELEPLVIKAPRLRIERVDVRVDNGLNKILEDLVSNPPDDELVVPDELANLRTPTGIYLRNRYTDITFLITEGLAGTRNFNLIRKIEDISRNNPSIGVRAAALVTLGFEKGRKDLAIFREALREDKIAIRAAAVEALQALGTSDALTLLATVATSDQSKALKIFASQAILRIGDAYGREQLLLYVEDPDWVIRAMAIHFLGELGEFEDYYRIESILRRETKDLVIAEACLALLRLSPV